MINPLNTCFFCHSNVTSEDYCLGCGNYICEVCDDRLPLGQHNVHEHLFYYSDLGKDEGK